MAELQIQKSTTVSGFEELLGTSGLGSRTLLIPNSISSGGGLGASAAFAQFLLTWARASETREIQTYLTPEDKDGQKKFVQRLHGFAAAYYGKKLKAAGDSGIDLRRDLLRAAKERVVAMHGANLQESGLGTEIEMIFVRGAKNEFHGSLYSKAPNSAEIAEPEAHGRLVRSKKELNFFLERCFQQLHVHEKLKKHLLRADLPFGSLLAEAFRNTAEHGFSETDGGSLDLNLRCVRVARTQIKRDRIEEFGIGNAENRIASRNYFTSLANKSGRHEREHVDVIEISIFDSGRGFARTFRETEHPNEWPDVDLVRTCFLKHRSAKPQASSGLGIQRMLTAVAELDGFIRFRTSSAEAFYSSATAEGGNADPASFVHGGMTAVEGTLITVGIPVAF